MSTTFMFMVNTRKKTGRILHAIYDNLFPVGSPCQVIVTGLSPLSNPSFIPFFKYHMVKKWKENNLQENPLTKAEMTQTEMSESKMSETEMSSTEMTETEMTET